MALQPIEGQPGLFREFDEQTGQPMGPVVNIRDFREGDKYDTIAIPTGPIQPGAQFIFFQDLQGKRYLDTNLRTPARLSAGESMVLDRIGLYVRSSTGITFPAPQDFKTVMDNSFYRLMINDILQDEGPSIKFPSGYGLYGMTNENGQGIVSVGVPATASAARLVKKQLLNQNHELRGEMIFDPRPWLTTTASPAFATPADVIPVIQVSGTDDTQAAVLVTNYLHGLIRSAVTK